MAEEYIITLTRADIIRPDKPPSKSNGVFCKVKYSHQEYKSKTIKAPLTKPEFKETFRLKKVKMDDDLILELWDWETQIKSEIIGTGTFSMKGLKFKKNTPASHDLSVKTGKTEKKTATVFFEVEYTREGIESEQEKEHKILDEKPEDEEKKEEPEPPPKKKREPLPVFELPKREKKTGKTVQKKLLGDSYSDSLREFGDWELDFEKMDFEIDEKVRIAVMASLHELGKKKPGNPVRFLGNFLVKYESK